MMIMVLIIFIMVVLIVPSAIRSESWKSSVRMIDADWLDETEKFRLLSRWGDMS